MASKEFNLIEYLILSSLTIILVVIIYVVIGGDLGNLLSKFH